MKKKIFGYAFFVVMIIITFIFKQEIMGGYFFSLVCFYEYNTAFNEGEEFFTYNPLKVYYKRKGRLDKYKSLMKRFIIFWVVLCFFLLFY